MSAFLKIEQALINSLADLALNYPIEWPNTELSEGRKGDVWLKLSIISAESNVATLGALGENNNPGIMQIDVNVPRGTGGKKQLEILDILCTHYVAGKALQYGGESAKITNASLSPLRYVDGYARRSASINYYSRTLRS